MPVPAIKSMRAISLNPTKPYMQHLTTFGVLAGLDLWSNAFSVQLGQALCVEDTSCRHTFQLLYTHVYVSDFSVCSLLHGIKAPVFGKKDTGIDDCCLAHMWVLHKGASDWNDGVALGTHSDHF